MDFIMEGAFLFFLRKNQGSKSESGWVRCPVLLQSRLAFGHGSFPD